MSGLLSPRQSVSELLDAASARLTRALAGVAERAGVGTADGDSQSPRYLCRVCGATFDRRVYDCPHCEGTFVVAMDREPTSR